MARERRGDPSLIREINLSLVLTALRDHAPTSRASLATLTGLTKATVSHLVEQLTAAGLVTEQGKSPRSMGRPGILLELNRSAGAMIGIEVGVDFISLLLADFGANVLWRHHERTGRRQAQADILKLVAKNIQTAIDQAKTLGLPVLGLALGVPGLVDVESGTLLYAPNLNWENVPLHEYLTRRFDLPVYIDNEASIAAFGETYFGVARGTTNMVFIHAGVGIGGGLVLNGRMFTGSSGFAAEVGHMTIEPNGLPCNCGNRGCWETLASQAAVFRRVQTALAEGKASTLARFHNGKRSTLTIPLLVRAADDGDAVAREVLYDTGTYLGIGIANLVNALNPEMVVLGGPLSLAKDYLMPSIQETLHARAFRWSAQVAQLVVAANRSDDCTMGGIGVIHDRIMRHPLQARRADAMPNAPPPAPREKNVPR